MRALILCALTLVSSIAFGACFEARNFDGHAYLRSEDFYQSRKFMLGYYKIHIAGENSRIDAFEERACNEVTPYSVRCLIKDGDKFVSETWTIDNDAKVVYYTKAMAGYGRDDGAWVMVGSLLGLCDDDE